MALRNRPLAMGLKPITGLADGVDAHDAATVNQLTDGLATKADDPHTHAESDVTSLVADLAGKEPAIAAGTTSQYWRGDKTWQDFPTGEYVRRYYGSYATYTTLSTLLPADNTVPTNTEGVEIISLSVVTDNATQRVRLSISGFGSNSSAGYIVVAAFRDTTCVGASLNYNGGNLDHLLLALEDVPGAAGTYTYSVRVGPGTAAQTVRLNGDLGARMLGGAAATVCVAEVLE